MNSFPQLKDPEATIDLFVVNADKELIYYIDNKNNVVKELDIKTHQIQTLTALSNGKRKSFFQSLCVRFSFGLVLGYPGLGRC